MISKSQTWVFVFCKGKRKKESVVSELARGHVSKFLLVGSNRMLVVQVAIVKLLDVFLLGLSF